MSVNVTDEMEFKESSLSVQNILLVMLATVIGMFIAAILLPSWLPNLVSSLEGVNPKGYWYLSRGSAFVAMALLWISMVLGVTITNKMAQIWPGGPSAFAIHEFTSLLGLAFAMSHGLLLLGDHYINYNLTQVMVPFASHNYDPLWVAFGQIGFYLWGIVALTFYVRRRIGQKSWRIVHYASYLTFMMAMLHGITSGSDSGAIWAQWYYWLLGSSLLFLFIYRVITSISVLSTPVSIQTTSTSD